jgi:hypothetical protein
VRIAVLVLVVAACASSAPSQKLKSENKRLRNELADARSKQTETEAKLEALTKELAQRDEAAKAKDTEIARLRTESSESWRELAEARAKLAADKRLPPIQCPQGTILDATGTACVPLAPPPPPPPPIAPAAVPQPVTARIIKLSIEGDFVVCALAAGKEHGVDKTWRAQFLRGSSTTPLAGGKAEIVRVDKRTTTIKVKMTMDSVAANPSVLLSPPPGPSDQKTP